MRALVEALQEHPMPRQPHVGADGDLDRDVLARCAELRDQALDRDGARDRDCLDAQTVETPRRDPITASAACALPACPVTAGRKSSRSSANKLTSPAARTVAVRGTSRSSAISPKYDFGPSRRGGCPSSTTSTSPLSTT